MARRASDLRSAVQDIVPMVHRARQAAELEASQLMLQHLRAAEDETEKVRRPARRLRVQGRTRKKKKKKNLGRVGARVGAPCLQGVKWW